MTEEITAEQWTTLNTRYHVGPSDGEIRDMVALDSPWPVMDALALCERLNDYDRLNRALKKALREVSAFARDVCEAHRAGE